MSLDRFLKILSGLILIEVALILVGLGCGAPSLQIETVVGVLILHVVVWCFVRKRNTP